MTDYVKVAVRWKANDVGVFVNGVKEYELLSASTFGANVLNNFSFDRGNTGLDNFHGKMKDLRI